MSEPQLIVQNLADVLPAPWRSVGNAENTLRYLAFRRTCSSCSRRLTRAERITRAYYLSAICDRCRPHLRRDAARDERCVNVTHFWVWREAMTARRAYWSPVCFRCPCCGVHFKFVPAHWTHSLQEQRAWRTLAQDPQIAGWPDVALCEACWHYGLEDRFVEAQDPQAVRRFAASLQPSVNEFAWPR